jgi:hypothetical protein
MNPAIALMAADEIADKGFKLYDKLSDKAKEHGWDLDAAVGDIANRLKDTALDTADGLADRFVSRPDSVAIIRALKEIPYDEGDIEAIYEDDVNDDGDNDVTAVDTTGDGNVDTVLVNADSGEEEKDAEDKAEDIVDDDDKTSTGKDKDELDSMNGGDHDDEKSIVENNSSGVSDLKSSWKDMVEALMGGRVY